MPDPPHRPLAAAAWIRPGGALLALRPVRPALGLALALMMAACSAQTPLRDPSRGEPRDTPRPPAGAALPGSLGSAADSGASTRSGSSTAAIEPELEGADATAAGSDQGRPDQPSAATGLEEGMPPDVATARAGDRLVDGPPLAAAPSASADLGSNGAGQARSAPAPLAAGDALAPCRDLAGPMAEALGLAVEGLQLGPADVEDPVWGTLLDGCQLSVEAPGDQLRVGTSFDSLPAFRLRAVLSNAGWREDTGYASVAPGETRAGYLRAGGLCIIRGRMRAPEALACAGADPTCGLPPEQLLHALALRCARF